MTSRDELKPCPFCGSGPVFANVPGAPEIYCEDCGIPTVQEDTAEACYEEWNTRTPAPVKPQGDEDALSRTDAKTRLDAIQLEFEKRGVKDIKLAYVPVPGKSFEQVANEAADVLEAILRGDTRPLPPVGDSVRAARSQADNWLETQLEEARKDYEKWPDWKKECSRTGEFIRRGLERRHRRGDQDCEG